MAEDVKEVPGIKIKEPDRAQIGDDDVLNFVHYTYGEPFFGSFNGMRYRLARDPLKDNKDDEEKKDPRFKLSVWEEPFSYDKADEKSIEDYYFEFTEDGRKEAVKKINELYTGNIERWKDAEENGIRRLLNT
ncbi:MAG: hypothetical protein K6F99_11690 [Lachnospiraceae bacterium]|nr:hypothetical protein [Lachnospiraceae bacterium]